jgi:hypothetical protein
MPIPFIWPIVGLLGLAGGAAGWSWWRRGRAPERLADVVPFMTLDPDAEIEAWSTRHGVDPALVRAVVDVESGGRGLVAGRPVVRVEVHLLQSEAPAATRAQLAQHFRRTGAQPWQGHEVAWVAGGPWEPLHHRSGEPLGTSQAREHRALALARGIIGDEPALRSTSIGAGQLLGRHAQLIGYSSATAMFNDASRGLGPQVRQMLDFIERDRNGAMLTALRAGDLPAFASIYNGPGQAAHYAQLIAAARAKVS